MKTNLPDRSNTFPIRTRCSKCGATPSFNEISEHVSCSYKDIKKYMYLFALLSGKKSKYANVKIYGKSVSAAFHRTHEGRIIGKYLHIIPSIQKFASCKCGQAYQIWSVETHDSLKVVPTNRRCRLKY